MRLGTQGRLLAILLAVASFTALAPAAPISLDDLNSHVDIDPAAPSGMYNWVIDGTDQLFQQWFWYRVGSTGPETPLSSLPITGLNVLDANFHPGNDTLVVRHSGAGFNITINYILQGGLPGSRTSDVAEQIRIDNLGSTPLEFHFFQYSNFNLNNTPDDILHIENGNLAVQTDSTMSLAETAATPKPTRYQADLVPLIINSLTDALPTTLTNSAGPVTGNVAFAFEWDREGLLMIPAGGSFTISKDKNISMPIPEPAALGLLAIGLLGLLRRR